MHARLLSLFAAVTSLFIPLAGAQDVAEAAATTPPMVMAPASNEPAAELRIRDAVILGLVEGVTEFLPISSTGHLIIANHALDLEGDEPLRDSEGKLLWYKPPSEKNPVGEPLTLKLAADTYAVVIQVGAIAAVVLIYAAHLLAIAKGLAGRNAAGLRLLRNISLAFLPCAVIGFLVHEWIEDHLFSIQAVVVALLSGSVLMLAAERWRRTQTQVAAAGRQDGADLSAKQALTVGLMQCFALWPGMSRSMMTMVGGYFVGLSPAKAAEFSFLVGLPTLAGAAFLKSMNSGAAMVAVFGWSRILLGGAVAAISAAIAVRFLVAYLTRHGLAVFAVYRVLLAIILGLWFFL